MSGDCESVGRATLEYALQIASDDAVLLDRHLHALRAALGIPDTASHAEAIETARRIAYEAETARLIETERFSVRCDVNLWVPEREPVWVVYYPSVAFAPPGNLHIAVRAAAGEGRSR